MSRWRQPLRLGAFTLTLLALAATFLIVNAHAAAQRPAKAQGASAEVDTLQLERQFFRQHPDQLAAARAQIATMPARRLPQITGARRSHVLPVGNWSGIGPAPILTQNGGSDGGPVLSLAIDPTTSGANTTIYLGAFNGGVWKSINNGASWAPLTDHLADLYITAIAIDPTNHNVIYASNGTGIIKTTDGGLHWTVSANVNVATASKIIVDPHTPQQLFVAGLGGLYESADGGLHWNADPSLPLFPADDVALNPATNPSTVYVTLEQNGIYRSTNDGASWSQLTNNLLPASQWNVSDIAVAPSHPSVVYAVTTTTSNHVFTGSFNGGYYSTDGGDHWAHMTSLNADFSAHQNPYIGYPQVTILVDPQDDARVYGLGADLFMTNDARGSSGNWHNITNVTTVDNSHVGPYTAALAFPPCSAAPCPIYAGTGGGIYTSSNTTSGSVTYANLNASSLQISSLRDGAVGPDFATSKQALSAVEYAGLAQYSGNAAWKVSLTQDLLKAPPADFNTIIDPTNPQIMYALVYTSTGQEVLTKTTDGGRIWGLANKGLNQPISRLIIDPVNHLHLAILMGGYLYESLNGGSSWYQGIENITEPVEAVGISPVQHNVMYAVQSDGTVLRTTHGGNGQANIYTKMGKMPLINTHTHRWYPMTVDPRDARANTIYVSTFNCDATACQQSFVQSTDGGAHWTIIGSHLYNLAFVHDSVVYYSGSTRVIVVGTYLGVFFSTNDGATWSRVATNLPNSVVMWVAMDKAQTALVAFTLGRGAFAIGLG